MNIFLEKVKNKIANIEKFAVKKMKLLFNYFLPKKIIWVTLISRHRHQITAMCCIHKQVGSSRSVRFLLLEAKTINRGAHLSRLATDLAMALLDPRTRQQNLNPALKTLTSLKALYSANPA